MKNATDLNFDCLVETNISIYLEIDLLSGDKVFDH